MDPLLINKNVEKHQRNEQIRTNRPLWLLAEQPGTLPICMEMPPTTEMTMMSKHYRAILIRSMNS